METGEGHCCSVPRTLCQIEYDKANKRNWKECLAFFLTIMIIVLFIGYFIIYKFTIRIQKTDKWFIVINFLTNTREYTPASMEYSNVIIWLNDLNQGSDVSASPLHMDDFYSKNTRLVFLESSRRKMGYKVLGQTETS